MRWVLGLAVAALGCSSGTPNVDPDAGGGGADAGLGGGTGGPGDIPKTARFLLTARSGQKLAEQGVVHFERGAASLPGIQVDLNAKRQTIIGFGGSFTESSAQVLAQLPPAKRLEVIDAYFGETGAHYSLTRTHIGSSDFGVSQYSYVDEEDPSLESFTLEPDRDDLIPLILDAKAAPGASFQLMASPWTAPPWMKTNGAWFVKPSPDNNHQGSGGRLKPEHYATFASYLAKYVQAYAAEGIDVWAITPENEPLGNSGQWESMEFSPEEMNVFIRDHLGPRFAEEGLDTEIYIFDQNRSEAEHWASAIIGDPQTAPYVAGTALHWYGSTVDPFPEVLDALHAAYPDKKLLNSEATIDALRDHTLEMTPPGDSNVPWGEESGELHYFNNDAWWWGKNATDWGFRWADNKSNHPIYEPVYRYTRDIIVGLNHWFVGWIDWNLVLNHLGGPNHAANWCGAPVMIDTAKGEIYYTPLYSVMTHFSKYIRPGAIVLGTTVDPALEIIATSAQNEDGSLVVVVANLTENQVDYSVTIGDDHIVAFAPAASLQTILIATD